MTCIKTGCYLFIEPHGEYAYGDAFRFNDVYLFRVCQREFKRIAGVRHFTITNYDVWFDENADRGSNSTLVAVGEHVTDHGYKGIMEKADG